MRCAREPSCSKRITRHISRALDSRSTKLRGYWEERRFPAPIRTTRGELLNYRRAFEFVSTHFNAGTPIRERLIREIHRQLVDGVRGGAAAPGEYRRVQNYVVNSATGETIYTPPPPGEVPDLMRALVAWLNGHRDIHPVIVSAIAQFQLVHIHPFLMERFRAYVKRTWT